jgi:D-alanyl-D-alanine dipeptidase
MGMFALTQAWGYLPPQMVNTLLPYETASQTLICIDDMASPHYNMVIDYQAEGLPADNLPSHEDMLLSNDVYKYTIFVAHNSPNPTAGAGSCIFLHLWKNENDDTVGCTAMAEENMVRLLQWLDPAQSPILVQLTRQNYARLMESWDLPEIPAP